jgi:hypothetical protein
MDVLELLLQDGAVKMDKDPEMVKFIMGWYNGQGAFKDPKGKGDLLNTAYALRCLRILFSIHEADLERVGDFLLECLNKDGGFTNLPGGDSPDIASTYYGVSSLHCIGREFDIEPTRKYLLNLMEGDGAFIEATGRRKTRVYNSYYAVYCLAALAHEFLDIEKEAILEFIQKQQNEDYGYRRSDMSHLSTISSTTAALLVRYYFNPDMDFGELDVYVESLNQSTGGFLAFGGGVNPEISATFHALVCLRIMGIPLIPETKDFLDSCKGPNGGFVHMAGEPLPSLEDTYYGLASKSLL